MCGIAGVILYRSEPGKKSLVTEALDRMLRSLQHRGPDDQGRTVLRLPEFDVALGHTRLSIIDLTPSGHQPMQDLVSSNCITYNGEIYNYRELRNDLAGGKWQSGSDTEVILKGYSRYAFQSFRRLRGMFAFGLWDGGKKELICIRDPFGIKPLYYYATPHLFLFASEVRALLASGLLPRRINPDGLISYLEYGSVESPRTIIQDVHSLEAGNSLTINCNSGELRVSSNFYAPDLLQSSESFSSREEACSALRTILEESVQAHLVSDVPVAAFLSGGIDSSAIVGLMSKVSSERPRTITIVFSEKDFSEEQYARVVADQFQTDHKEIRFSESDLFNILPSALAAMDQPTIDGVNTYVISRAVQDAGMKVALSGLGGDELFGGYPTFRRAEKLRRLNPIPRMLRKVIAHAGSSIWNRSVSHRKGWDILAEGADPQSVYRISRQLFSSKEISNLIAFETRAKSSLENREYVHDGCQDFFNIISRCELQGYMSNMLLRDTDFMSMAHGIEVRVPFVDRRVVPFVLNLPGEWKRDQGRPKPLLLDAVGDLIPPEIWSRPKKGFVFPFHSWLQSGLRKELDEVFSHVEKFDRIGISRSAAWCWNHFLRNAKNERWSRPWALYVLWKYCQQNEVYFSF